MGKLFETHDRAVEARYTLGEKCARKVLPHRQWKDSGGSTRQVDCRRADVGNVTKQFGP